MPSLYTEDFYSYTDDARTIDRQAAAMAKKIVKQWADVGYSPREISQVIQTAVQMEECEYCLTNTSKVMRERKKTNEKAKKNNSV